MWINVRCSQLQHICMRCSLRKLRCIMCFNVRHGAKPRGRQTISLRVVRVLEFGLLGKHSSVLSVHAPYVGVPSGPIGPGAGTRSGKNGPSPAGGRGSFT